MSVYETEEQNKNMTNESDIGGDDSMSVTKEFNKWINFIHKKR